MPNQPPKEMLPRRESLGRGLMSLLLAATTWSGFSLWLAADGHHPSGPSLFEEQYQMQALVIVPVLLICWITFAGLLWQLLAKRRSTHPVRRWFDHIGRILGGAYLYCWLLPDIVAYALFDFETLARVAPFLPMVTTVFVVSSTTRFVCREMTIERFKASLYVLAAWIIQAIPVLVFIR